VRCHPVLLGLVNRPLLVEQVAHHLPPDCRVTG
jgi:hypothetical protein